VSEKFNKKRNASKSDKLQLFEKESDVNPKLMTFVTKDFKFLMRNMKIDFKIT